MTPKQEHFARVYVETGNASEAYRQAYNSKKMKPESIAVEASRLLQDPDISLMIDGIKEQHRRRHAVTVDDLLAELEQARSAAISAPNPQSSAAVAATMGKAKILGLLVDKAEIKSEVKDTTPPRPESPLSEQEVRQIIDLATGKGLAATIGELAEIVNDSSEKLGMAAMMVVLNEEI